MAVRASRRRPPPPRDRRGTSRHRERALRLEDHDAVAAVASAPAGGVAEGGSFRQHLAHGSHEAVVAGLAAPLLVGEENLVAALLFFSRHVIRQRGRARAGTRRILEDERVVEARLLHERARGLEVGFRLAGIAHDHVGGDGELRIERAQLRDGGQIFGARVMAAHLGKDAIRTALHGEMEVAADLGELGVGAHELVRAAFRVRAREADAREAVDGAEGLQEAREGLGVAAGAGRIVGQPRLVAHAVAQDALPEQAHLLHAARGEGAHLGHHLAGGAGVLVPAHVGDDAVAAAVVAAEQDGHVALERNAAAVRVHARRHLVVVGQLEDARLASAAALHEARDHAEPARPHGEVEAGQGLEDGGPHPLDGAAHEADHLHAAAGLALPPAPLLGGDEVAALAHGLALGHIAHGAGVHDHEVRVGLVLDADVPRRRQQGLDGLAIAHVHLATVGMQVEIHASMIPRNDVSDNNRRYSFRTTA